MTRPDPKRVAAAYRRKTAGEVRFVKDRGGDKSEWAWNSPGPSEREIGEDFVFNPRHLKPMALVLRSTLMALGHATSAHSRLVKVKSRNVSPDGSLGGKGYIQKIPDMRRQLMNCIEVLSAMSDTLYDEINAPHWSPDEDTLDPRDRDEVREIVEDAEEIKEDPEGWAQEEEAEEDAENLRMASARRVATLHVTRDMSTALEYTAGLMESADRIREGLEQMPSYGNSQVEKLAQTLKLVNRTLHLAEKLDA